MRHSNRTMTIPAVTIICLTDDIYCIGPRRISSQLKRNGFRVNLIFLKAASFWGQTKQRFSSHFDSHELPESLYRQLVHVCRDSLVVGLSVWTHQTDEATKITERLHRELDATIVWGGIHPTSFPEQSIEIVDGICMGEGEISFLRLAEALRDGRDHRKTHGFWFREGSTVVRNTEEPLVQDLDDFPFSDFEFEDHFVNDGGILKRMDMRLMKKYYGGKLWMMFSQGCPYKCTFCSNDLLIDLNDGYRRFRHHSVDFFLAELAYIFTRYPHIYNIVIDDDAYMFLPKALIREFAAKYKAASNVPFFISGIIPASIEQEKFQMLMESGMIKARIGIQSGNHRVMQEVFVRPLHEDKVFAGSEIAYRNRRHLAPVQYDLIVDNPWETPDELKDTLRLVHRMKQPYTFAINSLTLLPGTTIYRMAKEAGIATDDEEITLASYVHYRPTLLNLALAFYNIARMPDFLFNYVINRNDFGDKTVNMKQYPLLGTVIRNAGLLKKLVHGLMRRDVSALPRPLDRLAGKLVVRPKFQGQSAETNDLFRHAVPHSNDDVSRPIPTIGTLKETVGLR